MNQKIYINDKVKTNNFTDPDLIQKILSVWSKVPKDEIVKYGIYHHYENTYKGDYVLSIGTEEIKTEVSIELPQLKYQIFVVDTSVEQGVFITWKNIWELEDNNLLTRSYILDYEKYYPNGKIEIHIGIK